ncbi:Mor transcription activator family protein [Acinetobacter chinensis]|jgi:hypothetical protein|uniref:Mor transcription activator family protein n=1 Tax=Acinetobacter chinensis TaxID=2004650 RepID=UPI00293414D1|nr:Mor transcription activator family protein [Acinetobacter chinensis]WOE42920.1 Mor transcription activator family protein [Acinetobacter chinensis]
MAYRPHITDAQQVFSDEEIINLMPKNFAFVAKLIGVEASINLIQAYGGTSIFVPSKHALKVSHEITHIIGLKALKLLSEQLGNGTIEIPMGTPITVAMRNKAVRDHALREPSKPKLARHFGLTLRSIRTILNADAKLKTNEDRNYDLFAN